MGFFGPYSYKAKNGKKYFLHSMERGNTTIYFFSEDQAGAETDMPPNYEVFESERTGLPMLKKKEIVGLFGGDGKKEEGEPEQAANEEGHEEEGKS